MKSGSKGWLMVGLLAVLGGALGYWIGWGSVEKFPEGEAAVGSKAKGAVRVPTSLLPKSGEKTAGVAVIRDREAWMESLKEVMEARDREAFDGLVRDLEAWSLEELSAGLRDAWAMKDLIMGREAGRAILGVLAKRDPRAAYGLATELDQDREREMAYDRIFWEWAKRDPAEAFAEYQAKRSRNDRLPEHVVEKIFWEWYRLDKSAAFEQVRMLSGDKRLMNAALDAVRSRVRDSAERERVIAFVDSLSDPEVRRRGISKIVGSWAFVGGDSLKEAIAWSDGRDYRDADERSQVEQVLGKTMMAEDPATGAAWLMGRASEATASDYLLTVVEEWARRAPNGCAEWLKRRGLGPETDGAVSEFAYQIMRDDPESAYAWAQEIRDAAERDERSAEVLRYWRRMDPDAAAAVAGAGE